MTVSFTRSLGYQSGVQLNPLVDGSEIPSTGNADQSFAIMMRSTRGRIDKAFSVDSSNFFKKLGYGESLRSSPLNEAWIQAYEALNNGAASAAVVRLVGASAKLSWITATIDPVEHGITFDIAETLVTGYSLAVKHLGCFNDGIKIAIHAPEKRKGGTNVANDEITLTILDSKDVKLYEFTGSLTLGAKDDYGNSYYLPDVIESMTDEVQLIVASNLTIDPASEAYGFDDNGLSKVLVSSVMSYFSEGTVGDLTTAEYIAAREKLEKTLIPFKYLASGGSKAVGLLSQMMLLAHNTNRQFKFDVAGDLTPEQVITFMESLNATGAKSSHLIHAYWTPLKTNDPTGINGKSYIGTSGLNIGLACGRNAAKNSKGFAPKNYPIAGRLFPVNRTGVIQTYTPLGKELSQLAAAKVNPVIFESYESGGLYVFLDSLTCAPVTNSLRKLIAVADMSTSVDDAVTSAGKMFLQLPMSVAVKRMKDWMQKYFEDAESSEWIKPSNDPEMGGASFVFKVAPNEESPHDKMDVMYWVHYDGTARQIVVTQTLTK